MPRETGVLRVRDEGEPVIFRNREDAGRRLGKALEKYRDKKVLVLGIPRGGVEVAFHAAKYLHADLSILVARKLPYPDNPEAGFGALAEDGSAVLSEDARFAPSEDEIRRIGREQEEEIHRRIRVLRKGKPLPEIAGRTVILIDDGLAMGSTMKAAIALCRKRNAAKIVVAVPVAGDRVAREIGKLVEETVILEKPVPFFAVAQAYADWYDVPDEEVVDLLSRWAGEQADTGT